MTPSSQSEILPRIFQRAGWGMAGRVSGVSLKSRVLQAACSLVLGFMENPACMEVELMDREKWK